MSCSSQKDDEREAWNLYEGYVEKADGLFRQMNLKSADSLYNVVRWKSKNTLLRLRADVGMMNVSMRRSANREFYVYSTDAQECIERLEDEQGTMDDFILKVWHETLIDYYCAQSVYHYYLREEGEGSMWLRKVEPLMETDIDDRHRATYYFLIGNARNTTGKLSEENTQNLLRAVSISYRIGNRHLGGKALTSLVYDMLHHGTERPSRMAYLRELTGVPDSIGGDSALLVMAEKALKDFHDGGYVFDESQTYIVVGKYYLEHGDASTALDYMLKAWELVERYGKDVPEWTADVREQLCIVYSELGNKPLSDVNRNAYLDILEQTRQDNLMDARLNEVMEEKQRLNNGVIIGASVIVLLLLFTWFYARRLRRKYNLNYVRERALVAKAMREWKAKTDEDFLSMEQREEDVVEQHKMQLIRLDDLKRRYVDRATCLSIVYAVTPFLDRAVREVDSLVKGKYESREVLEFKLQYVDELIHQISKYNDVLTAWIQVKRGAVQLRLESFAIEPLFEILRKSVSLYAREGITLIIQPAEAVVKADRALTLFMVNTLMDNARKFTPKGGSINVRAEESDSYVEISVADSGIGMSEKDVELINTERMITGKQIGTSADAAEMSKRKGSGFGLLNCKGVMEQYRRQSPLFQVCEMRCESKVGEGSRFFFRLPKGVLRCIAVLLIGFAGFGSSVLTSCSPSVAERDFNHIVADSLPVHPMLEIASAYADSAYFANVDAHYDNALAYVDSACSFLNKYYLEKQPNGKLLLKLCGNRFSEIDLWQERFITDYHIILDIRNEAAIAALATKQFDIYYYNNEIYSRLYKLMAQDTSLEQYCNDMQQANTNQQMVLIVVSVVVLLLLCVYFFSYYRHNILTTFNLRQIMEINRRIFNTSVDKDSQLPQILQESINDIRRTDGIALLHNDDQVQYSANCPYQDLLPELLTYCRDNGKILQRMNGFIYVFPLVWEIEGTANEDGEKNKVSIGALALCMHQAGMKAAEEEMFGLIAKSVAYNFYYSTIRMQHMHNQIEIQEDERRRAQYEADRVHVQNMVLDNCLSTIKHETMYYPSRILQLVEQIKQQMPSSGNAQEEIAGQITDMYEAITYYKEIYTLLSECASRQYDVSPFKRQRVPVAEITGLIKQSFRETLRRQKLPIDSLQLNIDTASGMAESSLLCDKIMMEYLFQNVFTSLIADSVSGTIDVRISEEGGFVKFEIAYDGLHLTSQQCHNIFYPDNLIYNQVGNTLQGAGWLIAKQIIREHDERVRRGCRIYFQYIDNNSSKLIFTIPQSV